MLRKPYKPIPDPENYAEKIQIAQTKPIRMIAQCTECKQPLYDYHSSYVPIIVRDSYGILHYVGENLKILKKNIHLYQTKERQYLHRGKNAVGPGLVDTEDVGFDDTNHELISTQYGTYGESINKWDTREKIG